MTLPQIFCEDAWLFMTADAVKADGFSAEMLKEAVEYYDLRGEHDRTPDIQFVGEQGTDVP